MIVMLAVLLTVCVSAERSGKPRVVDNAGILSSSEESSLSDILDEISDRQKCDVAVVTVTDTNGKSIMDYADDYYDYNGYADDGVMLIICMDGVAGERSGWITTKGKGVNYLTDYDIDDIGYTISSYLSNGNYYDAFVRFADLTDEYVTENKRINPVVYLLSAMVGIVVALIGTGAMKKKLKSVNQQYSAMSYVRNNSLDLRQANELYLYSNVTRTAKPKDSEGGRSSTHTSSSGSSHGGGGFRF